MNPRIATGSSAQYGYEGAVAYAVQKQLKVIDVRPHILKLALPLNGNDSVYKFEINQEIPATEQRSLFSLEKNDAFYNTGTGLCVARVPVHKAAANGAETIMWGNAKYYFHADEKAFTNPAPAANQKAGWAKEFQAIETVWAGTMEIMVEDTVIVSKLDTSVFQTVPETQTSATLVNSTNKINTKNLGKPFGFFGDKTATVTVQLGNGDYLAIAGDEDIDLGTVGYRNYLVLQQTGFLIRKAAQAQRIVG